jgi:glycosyltransferase involved in cell wall biosynthesis
MRDDDELVVVDSASSDAARVADVAVRHGARLVRCALPGVDRARNAGWREARCSLVAFTDDDVVVDDGWLDAFADCFARHPEASFATGRIGVLPGQEGGLGVATKDDPDGYALDARTRRTFGHSANLAVRRESLEAVGGFDESLGAGARFMAAPEGDLFDRLLASGRTGRYEPAAAARHDQWRRVREVVRLDFRYGVGSGARMSKLLRTDRRRLRVVAVEYWWGWGVAPVPRFVSTRDWHRLVATGSRLLGYVVGFLWALSVPVRDGHFATRAS